MNTEASAVEDGPGDFWKKNKNLVKVLVATVVHPASRLAANYTKNALREACARVVDKLRVSAEQMVLPKKARRADAETSDAEEKRAEREAAPSVTSAPSSAASSSAASSSTSSDSSSSSSSPSTETPTSPADDGHRMLVYFQQPPLVRCRLSVALEEGWL
ncbi:zinc finger CCHC domain-containing protein 10-like [Schistocerca nitens]|uniref:zinc finger CCHC domain-containing protein 10-like n=1 Tax=Schistocerca nitens TaxID=7011 RepID=UPI00211812E2|nr:zinc finger CCHC domain-containing protein 10-like [Schistocerca nitens]